jgi:hypothetical protein
VPKEMKLEHSSLSDEELDQAIAAIKAMLPAQAGEAANVIEGTAEPAALPAPEAQSEPPPRNEAPAQPNRLRIVRHRSRLSSFGQEGILELARNSCPWPISMRSAIAVHLPIF